jgi:hypothetical protein
LSVPIVQSLWVACRQTLRRLYMSGTFESLSHSKWDCKYHGAPRKGTKEMGVGPPESVYEEQVPNHL